MYAVNQCSDPRDFVSPRYKAVKVSVLSSKSIFSVDAKVVTSDVDVQKVRSAVFKKVESKADISIKLVKVFQNSGDCVAFNEKESVIYVSAIEGNQTLIDEVIYNFMFKFCHDNVCQHWTERSTHANTHYETKTHENLVKILMGKSQGFHVILTGFSWFNSWDLIP